MAPYRFKALGTLTRPKGVNRADGCLGKIRVTVDKAKKTTILTGSCTFSRSLTVAKPGRYTVKARFLGTKRLKQKAAKRKHFRAG